jgi:3-oxoacyl-[acyl-carrier protein] reductase
MFDLSGKTALVTGATGGIGAAISRAFHEAGATVAISGRQSEKLESLAKELGERVYVLPCDLADRAAVAKLIDQAIAKMGGLSILVNNAGLTRDNLFMVMKDEQWDDVIAVSCFAELPREPCFAPNRTLGALSTSPPFRGSSAIPARGITPHQKLELLV